MAEKHIMDKIYVIFEFNPRKIVYSLQLAFDLPKKGSKFMTNETESIQPKLVEVCMQLKHILLPK